MTILAIIPGLFITGGLAAAGVAATSIPIAIHLLTRLRRQRQPWAAMRFLMEAYRKQRQRIRLEQLLLLLVRCLIILVLGLALAGPFFSGLTRVLGGDSSSRVVCFVLDDALSTQAVTADQTQRFDHLRQTARQLVDALAPGDRVALWTTARPLTARLAPPTNDQAALRKTLTALTPRFSHSDWPGTLAAVNAALNDLGADRDRVTIVLLSDFSAGTLELDRPAPADLASLGRRGQILVTRPAPALANVQIASLNPLRSMILAEADGAATIPVEVHLRRFVSEVGGSTSSVRIDLLGEDPAKPVASVQQEFRWATGQGSGVLNADVPLPGAGVPGGPTDAGHDAGSGQGLTLRATLQAGGDDVISADNQRLALVELRRRLEVGLIDELAAPGSAPGSSPGSIPAATPGGASGGSVPQNNFRPHDWLSLVLAPDAPTGSAAAAAAPRSINLVDIVPAAVDTQALSHLDAVMVLRPDLMGTPGWAALKSFAQRGGLVWVFTPPVDSPALWASNFREQMGLDWQIGLAAHAAGDDPNPGAPGLAVDAATPEPLRLLSADWQPLLRPVSIKRRLDLSTRGGQESIWLKLGNLPPDAPQALLASASVGEGHVLFLATALDPAWTNLMTKPLFVPLLHEALRGVLGSSGEAARANAVACGDQPALGPHWEGTQELVRWGEHNRVGVRRTDRGLEAGEPLDEPGVYVGRPGAGHRLAVNPDADAGNTTPLDPAALGQWLGALGEWSWIDDDAPAKALLAEPARTNLGWPLLWVTLALLLLETYLARAFSHAVISATALPANASPASVAAGAESVEGATP